MLKIRPWLIVVSCLLSLTVLAGDEGDFCAAYALLSPSQTLEIRPAFLANHHTQYRLLLQESPVRNQCRYGGCWAYRSISYLERRLSNLTGTPHELSESYLIIRDLQDKARNALTTPGAEIKPGNTFDKAEALLQKYGAVPREVWQPRIPFEEAGHGDKLLSLLNDRVARFHYEAAGASPAARKALETVALRELDQIIQVYSGPLPGAFSEGGRNYKDPLDYFRTVGGSPPRLQRVSPIRAPLPPGLTQPKKKRKPNEKPARAEAQFEDGEELGPPPVSKDINDIVRKIALAIKRGESVPIQVEMAHRYIDKTTGIMSLAAFPSPKGSKPAPYAYRSRFGLQGPHAMEIVGIDVGPDGKVRKFKVKNSWGTLSGEDGYYHMYADYFREYLSSAYFTQTPDPVPRLNAAPLK